MKFTPLYVDLNPLIVGILWEELLNFAKQYAKDTKLHTRIIRPGQAATSLLETGLYKRANLLLQPPVPLIGTIICHLYYLLQRSIQ